MNKLALEIISAMKDGGATVPAKSMRLDQILERLPKDRQKPDSTMQRHVKRLMSCGYVKRGLDDGSANTYYVTADGVAFIESQN